MQTVNDPGSFVRVKAVAAQLGVSLAMVYRLVSLGELPAHKIGKAVCIDRDGLQQYLDRSRVVPFTGSGDGA